MAAACSAFALAIILLATEACAQVRGAFDLLVEPVTTQIGAGRARLLLVGISDPEGTITGLERYLAGEVGAALTKTGRVALTDEAARNAALTEIHGNLADVIDPATAQKAGRLVGAAWLLKGTAYVIESPLMANVQLQLLRTETGEYWQFSGRVPLDRSLVQRREQGVVRPTEASRRPPLRLEMLTIASRRLPDGRDHPLGAVGDGDRLRSNDEIKVLFRTNADAYTYLIWVDTAGKATLQFPSREAGRDNRVTAGNVYSAPQRNDWYYLDGNTGAETLYLVASYERLTDLDALLRRAEAGAADGRSVRRELDRMFDDLRDRGAGGVRPGAEVTVPARGSAPERTGRFGAVDGYLQAVRRLQFRHDP
jgi:hypothetical protein